MFTEDKRSRLNWIVRTYEELVFELSKVGVPFKMCMDADRLYNDVLMPDTVTESVYWHPQLIFDWGKGKGMNQGPDVIVGFLHCTDDYLFKDGDIQNLYCSIETYRFPFDHGDITVFGTPKECAKAIHEYYLEVTKK